MFYTHDSSIGGGYIKNSNDIEEWHPYSWRSFVAEQQPHYNDYAGLESVTSILKNSSNLVSYHDVIQLKNSLSNLECENGFFLQMGDCAESFIDITEENIRSIELMFSEMESTLLTKKGRVLKIGRIAGQFAKPRSHNFEEFNGTWIPVYRGDMINSIEPLKKARMHCPYRMIDAYKNSFKALSILDSSIYVSHEALVLEYESALTRKLHNEYMTTSAHFLWIGNRTRFLGSAHLEYMRGVANPVGLKIDRFVDAGIFVKLIKFLNPANLSGRVVIICRFGCENIEKILPNLIKAVNTESLNVNWVCDPMHGNTLYSTLGKKFRIIESIIRELQMFFSICSKENIYPSGVHLEVTAQNVMECFDKESTISLDRYFSYCDPRLNYSQSLRVIDFITRELI